MSMGQGTKLKVDVISTGSLSVDIALGAGGLREAEWSRSTARRPPVKPHLL